MTNSKRCVIFSHCTSTRRRRLRRAALLPHKAAWALHAHKRSTWSSKRPYQAHRQGNTPIRNSIANRTHAYIAIYICIYQYIYHIYAAMHTFTRAMSPQRSNTRPPLKDGKSQTPKKHHNGGDGHLRRFSQCTSSSPKPRKSLLAHTKHTIFNFFSNLV